MRNTNLAVAKAYLASLSSGPRPERPYASRAVATGGGNHGGENAAQSDLLGAGRRADRRDAGKGTSGEPRRRDLSRFGVQERMIKVLLLDGRPNCVKNRVSVVCAMRRL